MFWTKRNWNGNILSALHTIGTIMKALEYHGCLKEKNQSVKNRMQSRISTQHFNPVHQMQYFIRRYLSPWARIWVKYGSIRSVPTQRCSYQWTISFQENGNRCLMTSKSFLIIYLGFCHWEMSPNWCNVGYAESFYLVLNPAPCGRQLCYNGRGHVWLFGVWVLLL